MESILLGSEVSGLWYNMEMKKLEAVSGKASGLFVDPFGRKFVQIKTRDGNAKNVDMFTVNASSEDRQAYIDTMEKVRKIEEDGNAEIENIQKDIAKRCNEQISGLWSDLSPLVDLSFPDVVVSEDEQDS